MAEDSPVRQHPHKCPFAYLRPWSVDASAREGEGVEPLLVEEMRHRRAGDALVVAADRPHVPPTRADRVAAHVDRHHGNAHGRQRVQHVFAYAEVHDETIHAAPQLLANHVPGQVTCLHDETPFPVWHRLKVTLDAPQTVVAIDSHAVRHDDDPFRGRRGSNWRGMWHAVSLSKI